MKKTATKKKTASKKGGARKGAGRKPREVPRVALMFRVEPEIAEAFAVLCGDRSQAETFSALVKKSKKTLKKRLR